MNAFLRVTAAILPIAAGGVASIVLPPVLKRRGLKRLTRVTGHAN